MNDVAEYPAQRFIVTLQFRYFRAQALPLEGRVRRVSCLDDGYPDTFPVHSVLLQGVEVAFDALVFYAPQFPDAIPEPDITAHRFPALDSEQDATASIMGNLLRGRAARGVDDDVTRHLGTSLACYLLYRCGGPQRVPQAEPLAPPQLRLALALLEAATEEVLRVEEIAAQCALSTSHFTRAFADAMGTPPHKWRMRCRVERGKGLLLSSDLSIAKIAEQTGFADQSHFTRVFAGLAGATPAAWRHANRLGSRNPCEDRPVGPGFREKALQRAEDGGEPVRRRDAVHVRPGCQHTLPVKARDRGPIGIAGIEYDCHNPGKRQPIPKTDAFLIVLQLRRYAVHGSAHQETLPPGAGSVSVYDLRQEVVADLPASFYGMQFSYRGRH